MCITSSIIMIITYIYNAYKQILESQVKVFIVMNE